MHDRPAAPSFHFSRRNPITHKNANNPNHGIGNLMPTHFQIEVDKAKAPFA